MSEHGAVLQALRAELTAIDERRAKLVDAIRVVEDMFVEAIRKGRGR